jgi:methionyl-tRNA synthetase
VIFQPFIPFSAGKIRKMLVLDDLVWSDAGKILLEPGHLLGEPEILFSKLDDGFQGVMEPGGGEEKNAVPEDDPVDFDDFMKIRFRVGRILSVSEIKKANKLYRLEVDTGDRVRTVVAGMREHYSMEALQGRLVAVVCNLKPVKLCGVLSEGMLMASDGDTGVFLLEPGSSAQPGDTIR